MNCVTFDFIFGLTLFALLSYYLFNMIYTVTKTDFSKGTRKHSDTDMSK